METAEQIHDRLKKRLHELNDLTEERLAGVMDVTTLKVPPGLPEGTKDFASGILNIGVNVLTAALQERTDQILTVVAEEMAARE